MRLLRRLPLYLALLTLTQCSQCKKTDPTPQPPKDPLSLLPPETQSGAGTFGCLINGKAFTATSSLSATGDWQSPTRLALGGDLSLNGNSAAQWVSLGFTLGGELRDNKVFSILSSATPFPVFTPGSNQFISRAAYLPCVYGGEYFKTGQVTLVKFDAPARIASGRFAFVLYEPGGCDTLRVTNGRFDVRF